MLSLTGKTARALDLELYNLSPPRENFDTFLITPYIDDHEPGFTDAIHVEEAEGRAVCMSVPRFRAAKNGYDRAKICEGMSSSERGYGFFDLIVVGLLSATFTFTAVKVFEWASH